MTRLVALALLVGCSNILGIEDLTGPGNNPPVDGPPNPTDVPVGNQITVSLAVTLFDGSAVDQPLADAAVDFMQLPGTRLATGTTGADGAVTLAIPTDGTPVDGFFRVAGGVSNGTPHPPTSLYPLPLDSDIAMGMTVVTEPVLDTFAMSFGVQRSAQTAFVFVFVAQPGSDIMTSQGRAGIRVEAGANDRVNYDTAMGADPNATQTADQGTAYVINAAPAFGKALRAFETTTNREVGSRLLDATMSRTVHFAVIPTTP